MYTSQKFYSIIQNIQINQCDDMREIFDQALNYEYAGVDQPIEFRERNIQRMLVNSIRHNNSNYESGLKQVHRLNTIEETYFRYKNIVLNKIAEKYPFLQDECDQQKYRVNMFNIIK